MSAERRLLSFITIVCFVSVAICYTVIHKPFIAIHASQVWKWTLYKDDPFKDDEDVIVTVLAVKDGYVQYIYAESGRVSSMTRGAFLVGDTELLGEK